LQIANIMVHLGGDSGMVVPKYGVTPSEIATLIAIHGPSSVTDVEPLDTEALAEDGSKRTDRQEIERLGEIYGRTKINGPDGEISVMRLLFPGAGSRALQTLEELNLDESFYKAETRVKPKAVKEDPLDHDGDGKKGGSKPRKPAGESDIFE